MASLDAERIILGGVMISPDQLPELRAVLAGEDFYRDSHQALWAFLCEMDDEGHAIEMPSVVERALTLGVDEKLGGTAHLVSLPDAAPSTVNLGYYAQIVVNHAVRRRLRLLCLQGIDEIQKGTDPDVVAGMLVAGADDATAVSSNTTVTIGEAVNTEWAALQQRREQFENGQKLQGFGTGLVDLDKLVRLLPTNLVVIGARPGAGKSTIVDQIARHVAGRQIGVLSIHLEMSQGQVAGRALCATGRVDGEKYALGDIGTEDDHRLFDAAAEVSGLPLLIEDNPSQTISTIRGLVHRAARRLERAGTPLGLVTVDYLQLMNADRDSGRDAVREAQVAAMSRGLKTIAKQYKVCLVSAAQLNRKVMDRVNKRPRMSDLRESGAVEQDADVIIFIYRDELHNDDSQDKGIAEIIVSKQRGGRTGTARVAFLGEFTRFDNLAYDNVAPFTPRPTKHYGKGDGWG